MQGIKKHIAFFFLVLFCLWQGASVGHQHIEHNDYQQHSDTKNGELSQDCFQCDATFYSQSELIIAKHNFLVFKRSFIFNSPYNKNTAECTVFENSNKSPPQLG